MNSRLAIILVLLAACAMAAGKPNKCASEAEEEPKRCANTDHSQEEFSNEPEDEAKKCASGPAGLEPDTSMLPVCADIRKCLGAEAIKIDVHIAIPTKIDVRKPIPKDIRAMVSGQRYYAFYSDKDPLYNHTLFCTKTTLTINYLDAFYIEFEYLPLSGSPATKDWYGGVRVDDGESTKYKWVQDKHGLTVAFTLLSVTESYSVFLREHVSHNADYTTVYSQTWLIVISKNKSLSPDELAAIGQVEKDNGIDIKLTPGQNFKCKT